MQWERTLIRMRTKTTLNKRMDILYMADQLLTQQQQQPNTNNRPSSYAALLAKDLKKIVALVAPDSPVGQANVQNTVQVTACARAIKSCIHSLLNV